MIESDIRPKDLFMEYLRLSQQDIANIDIEKLVTIICPACRSASYKQHISKIKFNYKLCNDCGSLYCNPRPSEMDLDLFYKKSESSKFWAQKFFPAVAESRREKLFKPKAKKIKKFVSALSIDINSICDVGAGYGIFLEELQKVFPNTKMAGVEPSEELSIRCNNHGFETLTTTAENSGEWANRFDLVISSEVIEHVFSPFDFLKALVTLVKPGGNILLTGLGYEGFDILMLQENSNSISPPHHLNFLSIEGFSQLFEQCGLESIQIQTPGLLDFDIVRNSDIANEFVRVIAERGIEAQEDFQLFLQKYKLSSHVWCWGKKT